MATRKTVVSMNDARKGRGEEEANAKNGAEAPSTNRFMINRQSAVPLHIQLKEQIRYAIMSGDYQAGDMLPSIRELTAQLGIHRNTVHRVYLELQASGLLDSQPGRGVFVNDVVTDAWSVKELNAADALIERYFKEANGMGISPVTLSRLVSQRAPGFDARHPTVAFVECTSHQSQEFARGLSERLGITVQDILLDRLRESVEVLPENVAHVITSIFHFDEVCEILCTPSRKVHPITYELHPATRRQLAELEPGASLGFICHDANTEEVIGREINARVQPGVLKGCANLEASKMAIELIGQVDTVIFTEPAQSFCIKNCTPEHTLMELHFSLNLSSVEKVTRMVLFEP